MNIYIACALESFEKKIIKDNLKKHNLYFSNLKFKEIADNNFLKCEIVFGNIPSNWVNQSSKIKWLQLESTGFGEYSNVKRNSLNKDVIITNLKSFFACQVAQTTMAGIFSFYRGLDIFTSENVYLACINSTKVRVSPKKLLEWELWSRRPSQGQAPRTPKGRLQIVK